MKLVKRFLLGVAALLTVLAIVASIGLILFRAEPKWYRLPQITPEEREAAAQRATNKLAMIHNEAARLRAQQRRAATNPSTAPATQPEANFNAPDSITVSFTDAELNAFFDKWATWNNWRAAYEPYLTDPVLILNDGRMILAARVKELNTVASLHFAPRIDEFGRLHLSLEYVRGGRLPLPQSIFSEQRQSIIRSMQQRMPYWRQSASMNGSGTPNTGAISATMGTLLINVLNERPSEPVLFLPLVDQGAVPVRLTQVSIEAHMLTLTVEPLDATARAELLDRIRHGTSTAMGF